VAERSEVTGHMLSGFLHRRQSAAMFRHRYQGLCDGLRPAPPWYDE
jgi:hypothetical protein